MSLALHHRMSKTHPSPQDLTLSQIQRPSNLPVKNLNLFPSKWPK